MTSRRLTDDERRFVENNMNLVPFTISKYFGSHNTQNEDMLSTGYLALCRAASMYDPETGCTFSTYAIRCIRNAIHSDAAKRFADIRFTGSSTVSLNTKIDETDDQTEMIDLVRDHSVHVEDEAIDSLFYESIRDLVPTYARIFDSGLTIKDIAKQDKCTRQAVHSRMQREFGRARHELAMRGMLRA